MINKVLAIIAHPDDLEMMAGGTILKWLSEGKEVHVLVLTNGTWVTPDNVAMRSVEGNHTEFAAVAKRVGYTSGEMLDACSTQLEFSDSLVCKVMNLLSKHKIDTVLTLWNKDTNHDHQIASLIASVAAKRIPTLIEGQVNYYMEDFFAPNMYVDISDYWDDKIEAMKCYEGEWSRAGEDWYEFMDITTRYYGKVVGVKRAEGFIVKRFKL